MAELKLDPQTPHRRRSHPMKSTDKARRLSDKPLVQPLGQLTPGQEGRIVHLAKVDPGLLVRLSNLGLVPGATLLLRQLHPAAVVSIGATTLALDPEIAHRIYVSQVDSH